MAKERKRINPSALFGMPPVPSLKQLDNSIATISDSERKKRYTAMRDKAKLRDSAYLAKKERIKRAFSGLNSHRR